jgi:2-oxoglutarate ferredoxin oxidoreductase subunit alpha
MGRFQRVMTVEANWCDDPEEAIIDGDNRRFSALAMLLRARYLVDVESWCEVRGEPLKPGSIARAIRDRLG